MLTVKEAQAILARMDPDAGLLVNVETPGSDTPMIVPAVNIERVQNEQAILPAIDDSVTGLVMVDAVPKREESPDYEEYADAKERTYRTLSFRPPVHTED